MLGITEPIRRLTPSVGVQHKRTATTVAEPPDPFDATTIAGLHLWVKARSGAYTDEARTIPTLVGGVVGGLADLSGNAHHMFTTHDERRPLLTKVAGAKVLRFDAVDSGLYAEVNIPTYPYAMFFVFAYHATDPSQVNIIYKGLPNTFLAASYADGKYTYYPNYVHGPVLAAGVWHIGAIWMQAWGNPYIYLDGGVSVGQGNGAEVPGSKFILGREYNNGLPMDCDLKEVLVFDSGVSEADMNVIQSALSTYHGIPVTPITLA